MLQVQYRYATGTSTGKYGIHRLALKFYLPQKNHSLLMFKAYAFGGKENFSKAGKMHSLQRSKGTKIAYGL